MTPQQQIKQLQNWEMLNNKHHYMQFKHLIDTKIETFITNQIPVEAELVTP